MSANEGSTFGNSLTAPPGQLNSLRHTDIQTVANNDLYSVLGATTSVAIFYSVQHD